MKRLKTGLTTLAALVFLITAVFPIGASAYIAQPDGSPNTGIVALKAPNSTQYGWLVSQQRTAETYYLGTTTGASDTPVDGTRDLNAVLYTEASLNPTNGPNLEWRRTNPTSWRYASAPYVDSTNLRAWERKSLDDAAPPLAPEAAIGIVDWFETADRLSASSVQTDNSVGGVYTCFTLGPDLTRDWVGNMTYYFAANIQMGQKGTWENSGGVALSNNGTWNVLKYMTVQTAFLPAPAFGGVQEGPNQSLLLQADLSFLMEGVDADLADGLVVQWYKVDGTNHVPLQGVTSDELVGANTPTAPPARWSPRPEDAGSVQLSCAVTYAGGARVSEYSYPQQVDVPPIIDPISITIEPASQVAQGSRVELTAVTASGQKPQGTWSLAAPAEDSAGTLLQLGISAEQAQQNPATFTVPAGAPEGKYNLQFTTAGGASAAEPGTLTVTRAESPVPKIAFPETEMSVPVNNGDTVFSVAWGDGVAAPAVENGSIIYTWTSSAPGVMAGGTSFEPTITLRPLREGETDLTVQAALSPGARWRGTPPADEDLITEPALRVIVTEPSGEIQFTPAEPMDIQAGTVQGQRLTALGHSTTPGTGNDGSLIPLQGTWSITGADPPVQTLDLGLLTQQDANQNPLLISPPPETPVGDYTLTFQPGSSAYEPGQYTVHVSDPGAPPLDQRPYLQWAASNISSMTANETAQPVTVQWFAKPGKDQAAVISEPPSVAAGGGLVYNWEAADPTIVSIPRTTSGPTAMVTPLNEGRTTISVTVTRREGSRWALYVPTEASLTTSGTITVTASGQTSIQMTGSDVTTITGMLPLDGTTLTATKAGATAAGTATISGAPTTPAGGSAPNIFDVTYEPGTASDTGGQDTYARCIVKVKDNALVPMTAGKWTYTVWVAPTGAAPGVIGTFDLTVNQGLLLVQGGSAGSEDGDDVILPPGRVVPHTFVDLTATTTEATKEGTVAVQYIGGQGDGPEAPPESWFSGKFEPGTDSTPASLSVSWRESQVLSVGGPWTYRAIVTDPDGEIMASGVFRIIVVTGNYLRPQNREILSGKVEGGTTVATLVARTPGAVAGETQCEISPAQDISGDAPSPLAASFFAGRYEGGTATTPAQAVITWAADRDVRAGGPWTYDVAVKNSAGTVIASGRFRLLVRERQILPLLGARDLETETGTLPESGTVLEASSNGSTAGGTVRISGVPVSPTTAAAPDVFTGTYTPGTADSPARVDVAVRSNATPPSVAGTWTYTVDVVTPSGNTIASGTFSFTVYPEAGPGAPVLTVPATAFSGRPGGAVRILMPWANRPPEDIGNYTVEATSVSQTTPATPLLTLALDEEGASGVLTIPEAAVPGTVYRYNVVLSRGGVLSRAGEEQPPLELIVRVADRFVVLSSDTQVPVNTPVTVTAALTGFADPTVVWSAAGCGNPIATNVQSTSTRSTATFLPLNTGSMVVRATVQDTDGAIVWDQRVITVGLGEDPWPTGSASATLTPSPSTSQSATASASATQTATATNTATPSPSPSHTQSIGPSATVSSSVSNWPSPTTKPSAQPTTFPISPAVNAPRPVTLVQLPGVCCPCVFGLPISTRTEVYPANTIGSYITVPAGTSTRMLTLHGDVIPEGSDVPFATGQMVEVMASNGELLTDTSIIVPADVLGTGQLNIAQLVRLAQACTGERPLNGIYKVAGDFTENDRIDIADVVREANLLRG